MKQIETYFGDFLIFFKGSLLFLIGPLNAQLGYLMLALLIDVIFGIKVARQNNTFSWNILSRKVGNKIIIYGAWIAMFNALDMVAGLPNTSRTAVIVVLVSMEILSSSKNTARLGYDRLAKLLENVYDLFAKDSPIAPKRDEGSENNEQK